MRGGRKNTTWEAKSTWNHGETKTIRVPVVLADKIMKMARDLDLDQEIAATHGNRDTVLEAIERFIEQKKQAVHPNQHNKDKAFGTSGRSWDAFNQFRRMVEGGLLNG